MNSNWKVNSKNVSARAGTAGTNTGTCALNQILARFFLRDRLGIGGFGAGVGQPDADLLLERGGGGQLLFGLPDLVAQNGGPRQDCRQNSHAN